MYIHCLHVGLETAVPSAVALAKILRIRGARVAVMDMSLGYTTSMLANGMAVPEDVEATIPWIERLVTKNEIEVNVAARLTDTDVPVFRGMPDPLKAHDMAANQPMDQFKIVAQNLRLMEAEGFDFVFGVSEFAFDDVVGLQCILSDRIFLYGNSEREITRGASILQKFFPKLVLCLGVNVPDQYSPASGRVVAVIRDYETAKAVNYLRRLQRSGKLTADKREKKATSYPLKA